MTPCFNYSDKAGLAPATERGFSLIEIAIGMVILSLAAIGLIASISQQTEQRKVIETRGLVDSAQQALLSFASTNGRLPCPASAATAGQESIASLSGGIVTCSSENGLLPAVTLGLPGLDENGLLTDAWRDGAGASSGQHLRALRYSVSSLSAPVGNSLTSPALGLPGASNRRAQVQSSVTSGQGLFVCKSAAGAGAGVNRCGSAANTLAGNAVAVVWSRGNNGHDPANWSADENQNASQAIARVFVSRQFAPADATAGGFDDVMGWIAYPLLADRLLVGGHVM